jgi:hypothetical protein
VLEVWGFGETAAAIIAIDVIAIAEGQVDDRVPEDTAAAVTTGHFGLVLDSIDDSWLHNTSLPDPAPCSGSAIRFFRAMALNR